MTKQVLRVVFIQTTILCVRWDYRSWVEKGWAGYTFYWYSKGKVEDRSGFMTLRNVYVSVGESLE